MTEKSFVRELIELKELEAYKELQKKDPPKKPLWWLNPIKLYIILVLLYPVIGPAYKNLVMALWR